MASERNLYVVLIEHGGQNPPMKWYRWLNQLTGAKARGQKNLDGIFSERGGLNNSFVTVQEGAIITGSESLATSLANWLRNGIAINRKDGLDRYKPEAVVMGEISIREATAMSHSDEEFIKNMEKSFGRKGRRKKDAGETIWSVACFECIATYQVEAEHVITCPKCHATAIHSRLGETGKYAMPDTGDLVSDWIRQRFAKGSWEPSSGGVVSPPELAEIRFSNPKQESVVSGFVGSKLSEQLGAASAEEASKILDAVLVAQVSVSKEKRLQARALAAMVLFRDYNADPRKVVLAENPDDLDILDCSASITPEFAAAMFNRWYMNEKVNSNE